MPEMTLGELEGAFTERGPYMTKWGPGPRAATHCNKKLCFVATDKPFLVRLLFELSERADCHFVKYSIDPVDGMYLGRCFLLEAEEIGRTWARYKGHPKLMCSVQDDDFTLPFRDA